MKVLHIIREYRKDGFRYSVRDFVAGMMGNSSFCYGRFKTASEAQSAFPQARYAGCKHGRIRIYCNSCKSAEAA